MNTKSEGCILPDNYLVQNTRFRYVFWIVLSIAVLGIINIPHNKNRSILKNVLFNVSGVERFSYWRNASRDLKLYVKPEQVTIIHEPTKIVKPLYLLMIVISAPENFEARKAIRSTWGNMSKFDFNKYLENLRKYNLEDLMLTDPEVPKRSYRTRSLHNFYKYLFNYDYDKFQGDYRKYELKPGPTKKTIVIDENQIKDLKVRTLFMLGVNLKDLTMKDKIDEESKLYGDIIQENFIDNYQNSTIKIGMMLKWISNNCIHNVKYIMKLDDDVYVNVHKLIYKLINMPNPPKVLIGKLITNDKPNRYKLSKYYSPLHMYPFKKHPSFLCGSAYLMTLEAAISIYQKALMTPIYHLEDVYYAGICARLAEISLVHSNAFTNERVFMGYCEYSYHVTSHYLSPDDMYTLGRGCDNLEFNIDHISS